MKYYLQKVNEVFKAVESSENGLSTAEAKKRIAQNGKNELKQGKKKSIFVRFLEQFARSDDNHPYCRGYNLRNNFRDGKEFPTDVIIILAVVLINAVLGVFQESKAEKAIEALKEMSAATSKVLRDGKVSEIKSEDLTIGDVILLEAGDAVPADGRIIESASLKIEEAALTGRIGSGR